ncbi:MAG: GDP-mannose 4,6-dehydratase [Conexivisphaerales archaeon]
MKELESLTEQVKDRRFLVTGGAGFIGSHIAEWLVKLGAEVIILDDLSKEVKTTFPLQSNNRLKVIVGDVRNFDYDSLGRVDGIFNEAARALIPSFSDPFTDLTVNAGGTIRLLEYCRKTDTKLVHASSGSVYGNPVSIPISEEHPLNPISPYGISKLVAERYCSFYHQLYGVDVCMLRYFNVYGPRQSVSEEMGVIPIFVKRALASEPITIFGDGEQTRDFLNVLDVVKANILAYASDSVAGEAMNIGGGGKEISIRQLAERIKQLCSSESQLIFKQPKPGDIRRLVADNSKAYRLIGYAPSIDLDLGLLSYVNYVMSSPQ